MKSEFNAIIAKYDRINSAQVIYIKGKWTVRCRLDNKYRNFEPVICEFYSELLGGKLVEDLSLPLHLLDFVVFSGENMIVAAEVKSSKESQTSASAWYSYHVRTSGMIKPESIHSGVEDLPVSVKGFVATIDGQMREYFEKLPIDSIWLIQEGEEFLSPIEEALSFLSSKGRIINKTAYTYNGFLFIRIVPS